MVTTKIENRRFMICYRAIIHALLSRAYLCVSCFFFTFVCNTVERKRYVVEAFKANPSLSRSLGGGQPQPQPNRIYAAIKFSRNGPEPVSGVPPLKLPFHHLKLSFHHLAIQFGQLIFGSGKSLKLSSQILRLCMKFYFSWSSGLCPRPNWESLQRSFSTGGTTGGLGVTPLFENMGFAICPNSHRNTVGWEELRT